MDRICEVFASLSKHLFKRRPSVVPFWGVRGGVWKTLRIRPLLLLPSLVFVILMAGCLREAEFVLRDDIPENCEQAQNFAYVTSFDAWLEPKFVDCSIGTNGDWNCEHQLSNTVWLKEGEEILCKWRKFEFKKGVCDGDDVDLSEPCDICADSDPGCREVFGDPDAGASYAFSGVSANLIEFEGSLDMIDTFNLVDLSSVSPDSPDLTPTAGCITRVEGSFPYLSVMEDKNYLLLRYRAEQIQDTEHLMEILEEDQISKEVWVTGNASAHLGVHVVPSGQGEIRTFTGKLERLRFQDPDDPEEPCDPEIPDGPQCPRYVPFWYWQVKERGELWETNFSDQLHITKVRILRGNDTGPLPFRIVAYVGASPDSDSYLAARGQDETRCYTDPASTDGNIDFQQNCMHDPGGSHRTLNASPAYLHDSDKKARVLWVVEYKREDPRFEPPDLGENEELSIEFTLTAD